MKLASIAVQQFFGYTKKRPALVAFFFAGITLSALILIFSQAGEVFSLNTTDKKAPTIMS